VKIYPIVEGYGEKDAVPVLLRRLRDVAEAFAIEIGKPIRRKRTEFAQEALLRKAVRLALYQPDCAGVLVLFDADDDCPKDLGPRVRVWASHESGDVPSRVVMANREYEAWFLGAIESLRGYRGIELDATSPMDPEAPRNAKREVELRMRSGNYYSETVDQAPLSAAFDLAEAYRRSRSFRKLVKDFGELISSVGHTPATWPPTGWA